MAQLNRENYSSHRSANPPQYNLAQVKIGVIHMGLSAFHRGHQALFFEKSCEVGILILELLALLNEVVMWQML